MEIPMNQLADSEAYEIQRQTVQKAINTDHTLGGDVSILAIDYKAFEHTDEEKGLLLTLRKKWREGMRSRYSGWTKRSASRSWSAMNYV